MKIHKAFVESIKKKKKTHRNRSVKIKIRKKSIRKEKPNPFPTRFRPDFNPIAVERADQWPTAPFPTNKKKTAKNNSNNKKKKDKEKNKRESHTSDDARANSIPAPPFVHLQSVVSNNKNSRKPGKTR